MHKQRTRTASSPSIFPFSTSLLPTSKSTLKYLDLGSRIPNITFFTRLECQEAGEEREEGNTPGRLAACKLKEGTQIDHQSPTAADSCSGEGHGKQQQEGENTLTAGVLRIAVCFFKVVLCFAFHSPAESTFCWVENKAGMVTGQQWAQNHADRSQNILLCQ